MPLGRNKQNQPPTELNLVPMIDVLMSVLIFFIIISSTLALEEGVEVALPGSQDQTQQPQPNTPDPLLVKLTPQGILVNEQPTTEAQALQQVRAFLSQNRQAIAVLQSDPNVQYEQVVDLLAQMRLVGGDRVSLGLE
ncbi:MAG: biopolymer transporter ExbD [Oculatellaceae cyanobacterium Prado106]|jgi:biopolymer transport protein ExbD|nr:biopolymer transporter ExbD [Oculatellaceae cyanobacterium Prado106]